LQKSQEELDEEQDNFAAFRSSRKILSFLKRFIQNASTSSHSRARISERFVPSKGTFAPADLYRYFPLRAAKYKIIFENFRISLSTLFEYLRTLSEHADDIT